jgi:hypothetical protein
LAQVDQRLRAGLYHPEAKTLFTWYVARHCNLRCPYCTLDWDHLAAQPLPLGRALIAWRSWYQSHGAAQICCTGAEPMCRPEVVRVLGEISHWHVLDITSNMHFRAELLHHFPDPQRVFFSASYHPMLNTEKAQSVDQFRRRLDAVRARGFRVTGASVVAYPPLLPKLPDIRRQLESDGTYFSIHLYRGEFQGRRFPEGYSSEERGVLAALLGGDEHLVSVEPRKTLRQPCWTGSRYFLIAADGQAYRCWGAASQGSLGSFYRQQVVRSPLPLPCPVSAGCPCQELWPYHGTEAELDAARRAMTEE